MKKVEAIIRAEKLEDIKQELNKLDVKGITITQVVGCGNQKGQKSIYRGTVVELTLLPKIKLEIVCEDKRSEEIIKLICKTAKTGEIGDGKIFVYDINDIVRIRTGETGEKAI
ncbi:MAG TPA: P-II family nitrogen regulator [Ruminiclostridium sp.]|nr:P-II family nitrogen regulator [Ruminiclostridium sp.]